MLQIDMLSSSCFSHFPITFLLNKRVVIQSTGFLSSSREESPRETLPDERSLRRSARSDLPMEGKKWRPSPFQEPGRKHRVVNGAKRPFMSGCPLRGHWNSFKGSNVGELIDYPFTIVYYSGVHTLTFRVYWNSSTPCQ